MFCVDSDYSYSKLKGKKYKQNTFLKSHKNKSKFSLILGKFNRPLNNPALGPVSRKPRKLFGPVKKNKK